MARLLRGVIRFWILGAAFALNPYLVYERVHIDSNQVLLALRSDEDASIVVGESCRQQGLICENQISKAMCLLSLIHFWLPRLHCLRHGFRSSVHLLHGALERSEQKRRASVAEGKRGWGQEVS